MSAFRKFYILMTVFLIASIAGLFIIAGSARGQTIDAVALNGISETVRENWNDLDSLKSHDFGSDILVFDHNNAVVYSSSSTVFEGVDSPLDAVSEGMVSVALTDGDRFLGTLILPHPSQTAFDNALFRLCVAVAVIVVIMLGVFASFIYYINRNIVKPFRRMKEFASVIARGNFDEPLLMEKNNIFGIFTESFDVMREELRASKSREIALKMKEKELVASLSHDLKTPVTGIRVICELLEVKVEDEYVKGKIANIEQKTKEIDVLVSDLLSSSLDDLGEMNVNVCELTSDVLAKIVSEHDVNHKVSATSVPDCIILADRNRLSQVIGNIISNSYKYADTPIEVRYKFKDRFLRMDIRDFGSGVPTEEIDLITNKFYRGKTNTKGKDGSGLGLYISSELMKKMNGQLICSSEGDGFEVTLMIPLA